MQIVSYFRKETINKNNQFSFEKNMDIQVLLDQTLSI